MHIKLLFLAKTLECSLGSVRGESLPHPLPCLFPRSTVSFMDVASDYHVVTSTCPVWWSLFQLFTLTIMMSHSADSPHLGPRVQVMKQCQFLEELVPFCPTLDWEELSLFSLGYSVHFFFFKPTCSDLYYNPRDYQISLIGIIFPTTPMSIKRHYANCRLLPS